MEAFFLCAGACTPFLREGPKTEITNLCFKGRCEKRATGCTLIFQRMLYFFPQELLDWFLKHIGTFYSRGRSSQNLGPFSDLFTKFNLVQTALSQNSMFKKFLLLSSPGRRTTIIKRNNYKKMKSTVIRDSFIKFPTLIKFRSYLNSD